MEFQVKAVKGPDVVVLNLSALHAEDALALARSKGYTPISAKTQKPTFFKAKKTVFPLALFSQELLALLDAGLNLVEAIESLAEKEQRQDVKQVLDLLLESLYQGQTFSAALALQAEQSGTFPILYVATVHASEKTGDLAQALTRYVSYEQQLGLVKKKITSASIYPILLLAVGGMVILFLLGFVVPKFSRIYEDTGGDLPFLSQMLLAWGVFLESHTEALLIGLALSVLGGYFALTRPATKQLISQLFWRIPALGKRLRTYQLARFYRTLGMLLKGGTPILASLQSVSGLLDTGLQQNMQQATTAISEGQAISVAMEQAGLSTPIAIRMLRVGERSGQIGDMMERIASFYDEELSRWIDWFTRLFEPILMLFIGLIIGAVVLLLYMPIFELAGNIQ